MSAVLGDDARRRVERGQLARPAVDAHGRESDERPASNAPTELE
jgi:hypothetical protein